MNSRNGARRTTALLSATILASAGLLGFTATPAAADTLEHPDPTHPVHALGETLVGEVASSNAGAVGVYVHDLTAEEPLFAHEPDTPLIPASNTKVFTTAAVLDRFGADATLTTTLASSAPIDADGVLEGDLYLIGDGDPTFGTAETIEERYDGVGAAVEELIDAAKAAGLTRVEGDVIGDASKFDGERNPTNGLSGLTFDRGVHSDTPLNAAERLLEHLEEHAVAVEGDASTGTAPGDAAVIAGVESPTVGELTSMINKPSENFFAEMMLKNLSAADGAEGTTADGAAKAQSFALGLGAEIQMVNGSGLADDPPNLVAPRDAVALLEGARPYDWFPAMYESLPIAGVDGTLDGRMVGTAAESVCRAKTGTLGSAVSALSGYCEAADGHDIGFSILMNEGSGSAQSRAAQDTMTAAIASYSSAIATWDEVAITSIEDGSVIDADDAPTGISGTSAAGAEVRVQVGDETRTVVSNADGQWSIHFGEAFEAGAHTVTVTQTINGATSEEVTMTFTVSEHDDSGDGGNGDGEGGAGGRDSGAGDDGSGGIVPAGTDSAQGGGLSATGSDEGWYLGAAALLLTGGVLLAYRAKRSRNG